MTLNWEALDVSILGPAFAAGILVLATHVPLGRSVLDRGIIFIDLAVAQMAGLGVILASALGWDPEGIWVQGAAVGAALVGAILLHWSEKFFPEIQEALIGVAFVLAATLGLILLSNNPHAGEHLKDLLVGQILWVSWGQLLPVAGVYAVVLILWFSFDVPQLHRLVFYVLFAFTVTASVQLVGVYLVFASFILPALAARGLNGRAGLFTGYAHGALGYGLGLCLSALCDWPTGAVIVWALAVLVPVVRWVVNRTEVIV